MGGEGSPPPRIEPQPSLEQRLAEDLHKTGVEALKARYVTTDDLERLLCGGRPGSMVAAACERLEINPGYQRELGRVKLLWKQHKERIFEAIVQRIERQEKILQSTRKSLDALARAASPIDAVIQDAYYATDTLVQSIKLRNTPYAETSAGIEDDTMEMRELVALRQVMEQLNTLDTDELVEMVYEDHEFLEMIVEEKTGNPSEFSESGKRLLDPENPDYSKHLEHLVDFIQGKSEGDLKGPKSNFRITAEAIIWQEAIRDMDLQQKRDLITKFVEKEGLPAARTFITKAIITGSLTRQDVIHCVQEGLDLGDDSAEFLRTSVKAKEAVVAGVQEYVQQMEHPPIQNAADYFFSFDKMIGETFGRLGALTAILNGVVNVCDGITSRGSHESWVVGALRGAKDAMTDKYVIGGVAAAVIGSNIVYPWVQDWIYEPDDLEKERIAHHRADEFLREQYANHNEAVDYLEENYDDMMDIAEENLADPERQSLDIWRGDLVEKLKLSDEQAGQMGYENADQAEGVLIKLFSMCTKAFKTKRGQRLDNGEKLTRYLHEQGLYEH